MLGATVASSAAASAYTVTSCGPGCYDPDSGVMDTTLGVSDCLIEDFEDSAFIPEVVVSLLGTATPGQLRTANAQPWDGIQGYSNAIAAFGDDGYDFLIEFPTATDKFGVGFAHAGAAISVWVNGVEVVPDVFALPGFIVDGANRNGYVVVERESGDDPISSVELRSMAPESNDFIQIDHLAVRQCVSSFTNHWTFEAGVDDYLGGVTGINNGAAPVCATYRGQSGLGYFFDGSAYIETDFVPVLGPDDSMSISVWARMPDGIPVGKNVIYGLERTGGQEITLALLQIDGTVQAIFRDDGGADSFVRTNENLADGQWHHFVAIRDGVNNSVSLWVDGVREGTDFRTQGSINASNPRTLDIGANNNSTTPHRNRFTNVIDELRVYGQVLSEQEIRALAGLPFPCKGDLNGDGMTDVFDFSILADDFGCGTD
jgi:hypothetical protein